MKVLITGGCGFIGSSVVRKFVDAGHDVHVFDTLTYSGFAEHIAGLNVKFTKGDLRRKDNIEYVFTNYGPFDLVVHVAAESSVDRSIETFEDFITTNVLGSAYLFEACRETEVPRVINFGTDEIFGHLPTNEGSFTESTPLAPRNLYSASKAAQVMFANAFKETHKLPIINVCPSNCFGPRQLPEKLLPRAICLMMKEKPIPVYGTGLNVREWLFVEDLADAVLLLSEKGVIGETYNVGSNNERTNLDILHLMQNVAEMHMDIEFIEDRKGHDFRYSVDFTKIKSLGWLPKTPLQDALKVTVGWYKNNKDWLFTNYEKVWGE
jgi:dTDP-glucose 4,6-dehydratase